MAIARPPANSPKLIVQSTEGLNADQWQGVNLAKFFPDILQDIIDSIQELLDLARAAIELAIEALRILSALNGIFFDLIRALVEAIAQTIKDLLDLFPKVDAGIYLLYVNTELGGIDRFTNIFRNSLTDRQDPMRPPIDDDIKFSAFFLLWGYPFYDIDNLSRIKNNAEPVFKSIFNLSGKTFSNTPVPPPEDFGLQVSFFTKPVVGVEEVTNTIDLPENALVDGFRNKLRTTIRSVSRKSGTAGVAHNLRWEIPDGFSNFTRERVDYSKQIASNSDSSTTYIFRKSVLRIIGLEILSGDNKESVLIARDRMDNGQINTVAFGGSDNYAEGVEDFAQGTKLQHIDLSIVPGTNNIQIVPEDADKNYFYVARFVFERYFSEVYVRRTTNAKVTITSLINFDESTLEERPVSDSEFDQLSDADFEELEPEDIKFKEIDIPRNVSSVGPATKVIGAYSQIQLAPGGTPPDWISFRAFGDLLPEIQKFIDLAKQVVDNIVNEILDSSDELEQFIQDYIQQLELTLNQINDLINQLDALIFPPLAGAHYLSLTSQFGMEGIRRRFERSLQNGLRNIENPQGNGLLAGPTARSYNPILLDEEFQSANTPEFERRVNVPAYDFDHEVGGFILAYQDPSVGAFMENLLGIRENFTEEYLRIRDDQRLDSPNIRIPELRQVNRPTHQFVELDSYDFPDQYMNERGKYKSNTDLPNDPVNDRGNVEVKTKSGPFINNGPPIDLNIQCSEDGINFHWANVVLPKGRLTAEQVANLIPCPAAALDDGSLVIEAKYLKVSPCSKEAAELLGLTPGTEVRAVDENPSLEGDIREFNAGDYIVEFVNNGRADYEQRKGTAPIFQLKPVIPELLSEDNHLIKIEVEGEEQIVDVTGNSGTNDKARSPTWTFSATYPLTLVEANPGDSIIGNNEFTFQLSGPAVVAEGIDDSQITITMQPLEYRDARSINAEILRNLIDAGYPVGLFTTTTDDIDNETVFFLTEAWAQSSGVTLTIGTSSADFIGALDTSVVAPGTDYDPYTVTDIVTNLNAAFSEEYFLEVGQTIRITGTTVGPSSRILVYSASAENLEYATVARAIFGFNQLQLGNTEILGIGSKLTTSEYVIEIETEDLCGNLGNVDDLGEFSPFTSYLIEKETAEYIVEIDNPDTLEYVIEFV